MTAAHAFSYMYVLLMASIPKGHNDHKISQKIVQSRQALISDYGGNRTRQNPSWNGNQSPNV
jgi:hypothetical protein